MKSLEIQFFTDFNDNLKLFCARKLLLFKLVSINGEKTCFGAKIVTLDNFNDKETRNRNF